MLPTLFLLTMAVPQAHQGFITTRAPVIAITHVRVIDGTGAAPLENQTIVIRDGRIAALGAAASIPIPAGAEVQDGTGRTILPGYVMLHEHMYYPAGNGMYPDHSGSFAPLYLAGGTTTVRTGGSMVPYSDLNLKLGIDAGRVVGPDIDVTGPYLNGPGLPIPAVKGLRDVDDARRMVAFWADEGVTNFKAYMQISREQLKVAIDEAHRRGLKVTGHLCSVSYTEAADLGIDNLEHGFFAATDFAPGKAADRCPGAGPAKTALAARDPKSPEIQDWLRHLVTKGVAITSTLTVMETSVPGQPEAPAGALEAMTPQAREMYQRNWRRVQQDTTGRAKREYQAMVALEREFAGLGGRLVAGTDPTGYGGVVAGYSNQRMVELLVEGGFSAAEAIRIATLNGATYLGRESRIGSLAVGKQADLILIDGNPAADIADVRKVLTVFKQGVGYDSRAIFASVKGMVGWK